MEYYLKFLNGVLADRKMRNPRYSLRSFAKSIGLDSGTLSRILNRKTIPSRDTALAVVDALHLDEESRYRFIRSIECAKSQEQTEIPESLKFCYLPFGPQREIDLACLAVSTLISNRLADSIADIALHLHVDPEKVHAIADRLIEIGSIIEEGGKLSQVQRNVYFTDGLRPPGEPKAIADSIAAAAAAARSSKKETHKFETGVKAIDPSILPEVSAMIQAFKQELNIFLQQSPGKELFVFNFQFFPYQHKDNGLS